MLERLDGLGAVDGSDCGVVLEEAMPVALEVVGPTVACCTAHEKVRRPVSDFVSNVKGRSSRFWGSPTG